jgi:hypothetical protein
MHVQLGSNSTVNRWGAGVVQEVDSAAMHVFFRWQHLDLGKLDVVCDQASCPLDGNSVSKGTHFDASNLFMGLDIFQVGGVLFF